MQEKLKTERGLIAQNPHSLFIVPYLHLRFGIWDFRFNLKSIYRKGKLAPGLTETGIPWGLVFFVMSGIWILAVLTGV